MLDDEAKSIPTTTFMTSKHFQSKSSASKSAYDFGSSSSTTPDATLNSKMSKDDDATKPSPSTNISSKAPPNNSYFDSESSAGEYIDPFSLLEIQTNVSDTMQKVASIETSVTNLNTKMDQKVSGLDSKLDVILQSLSQHFGPFVAEREAQLD